MSELAARIEDYLLQEKRWVPARELVERFGIRQRAFRRLGTKEGLCSNFAISGDKGYMHVRHASEKAWERCKARLRAHAIGELTRLKHLRQRREALTG